jgi:cell division protease FtsH
VQDAPVRRNYSEETARLIDEDIARLIRDAHARVRRTLTDKRAALDALARMLLEHEVVDRSALDQVLRSQPPPAPRQAGTPSAAVFESKTAAVAG